MTTSWDCFDTLLARRHYFPYTVFQYVGLQIGVENFVHERMAAESRSPNTLDDIYVELACHYGWDEQRREQVKGLEVAAEIEHCFPVVENIQKVKDGDLIISDMYLPSDVILRMLRKCGLKAKISMHVSTGGKSSGWIWKTLPPIDLHVGDNVHSDVNSPRSNGIEAQYYGETLFSDYENFIGGEIALLMRIVRLANPYQQDTPLHRLWFEQSQLNIPALILSALELPSKNLAFVHRDCVHLQRIHEAIHKTTNTTFHCSRIALSERGNDWDDYVKETAYGKTIVDIQGSGRSILKYWLDAFKERPSMIYITGVLVQGSAVIETPHDVLERYNSSRIGSLLKWPEREEKEFTDEYLDAQYSAIDVCINYMHLFHDYQPDKRKLEKIIQLMIHGQTPAIVDHYSDHGPTRYTVPWPQEYLLSDKLALEKVLNQS
jgi:predicted HAD superfamily hydrolase